jgi:hypothetical protein
MCRMSWLDRGGGAIVIAAAIGVVILLVAAVASIYLGYSETDRRHVGTGCAAVRCYAMSSPMRRASLSTLTTLPGQIRDELPIVAAHLGAV